MPRFAFVAQGRLFLGDADGQMQEITSRFGEGIRERARASRDRHAWKTDGTGARFAGVWGARMQTDPDDIRLDVTSISVGAAPGEMFYTLTAPGLCGMLRLDDFGANEQRLWHSNDTRITDVARHPSAARIACSVRGADTAGIGVMTEMGSRLSVVTEGDSIDEAPRWIPASENALVYQSAGIGRNRDGQSSGRTPYHIQRLDVDSGSLLVMAEEPQNDLLAPQVTAGGDLYFIRRPYRPQAGPSWWRLALGILLIPWRLLQAVFQFFNFFSMRYTGKPLNPVAPDSGGAARRPLDVERMVLWGNVVDAQNAMRRAKPDETPDLVPSTWKLVRRTASGEETTLASGVLSYDLEQDGSVLFTNGSAIFRRDPDGKIARLLRAAYIERVVAVSS
jgi:hypothetical protein